MSKITQMIDATLESNAHDFREAFETEIRARILEAIQERKLNILAEQFGACDPEDEYEDEYED